MIMKVMKMNAYSVRDVKDQVNFELVKNATISWKKAGSPTEGELLKTFMSDYLKKETKNVAGKGCYIVLDQAVSDSRENPYSLTNIVTAGRRKFERVYELVNATTGEILGKASSKSEAEKVAKDVVSKKREELGIGVEHYCRIIMEEVSGDDKAFTFKYTPSQNTKEGTFLVFGVEKETEI